VERFASAEVFTAASSLGDAMCFPDSGVCSGVVVATLRDRAESVASFAGIDVPADGLRFVEGPDGHLGIRLSAALSDDDAAVLIDAMADGHTVERVDSHTVTILV